MKADIVVHPELYYTGYTQDSLKELTEACVRVRHRAHQPIPTPDEIEVDEAAYLNGLAEAASELRRRCLDLIRRDRVAEAERMLTAMDDIYAQLVTIDFPDALTGGLRRTTDTLRAVLERTRGDLTTTLAAGEIAEGAARDGEAIESMQAYDYAHRSGVEAITWERFAGAVAHAGGETRAVQHRRRGWHGTRGSVSSDGGLPHAPPRVVSRTGQSPRERRSEVPASAVDRRCGA